MRFLFFILPMYFFGTENVYNILLLNIFKRCFFPVEKKQRGISIDYLLNGGGISVCKKRKIPRSPQYNFTAYTAHILSLASIQKLHNFHAHLFLFRRYVCIFCWNYANRMFWLHKDLL